MMQTYTLTMSAGSSWDSYVSGRYFRVIDAAKPLDIDFFSRGNQKGTANDVGVGFWIKPTASFDRIIVRSAEAQTVTIMVGAGEAGRSEDRADPGEYAEDSGAKPVRLLPC